MGKFNCLGACIFFLESTFEREEEYFREENYIYFCRMLFLFRRTADRLVVDRLSFLQEPPIARISSHNAAAQSSTGIDAPLRCCTSRECNVS